MHVDLDLGGICGGAFASGAHLAYKLKHYFVNFTLSVCENNVDTCETWVENEQTHLQCIGEGQNIHKMPAHCS